MKAIVQDAYGSADALRLAEIERPVPGAGEVLLRVRAAGVDPGVWHLMTGRPYLVRVMGYGLRRPKEPVPGTDVAGTVQKIGEGVTRFAPGDEVFGFGTGVFAEHARAREATLAHRPAALGAEAAAAIPSSGVTALQVLRDRGELRAGQRVLVIGASGGVGTFTVQIAVAEGAEVTGVCSAAKADLVRSLGAADIVDHAREEIDAAGRTYDLVVDLAGNRPLSVLRRTLAPRGTLVIVGGEQGGRWLGGLDRQLRAALLSPFVCQRLRSQLPAERAGDLEALAGLVERGALAPVLDRTFPLAGAAEAIRYLEAGRSRGKVVLAIGG